MTPTTSDTTSDTTSEQPTDETTIECPTDLPLVRIVRTFDAPPAKVFRAHTDPSPSTFLRTSGAPFLSFQS